MGVDKNVLMMVTAMGRKVSVCKTQIQGERGISQSVTWMSHVYRWRQKHELSDTNMPPSALSVTTPGEVAMTLFLKACAVHMLFK